jgi:hypothetical protein
MAAAAAGLACASGPPPPPPAGLRVLLTTAGEWPTLGELAGRAAHLAGVEVRDVDEMGPRRYRLTLLCNSEAECRNAVARIQADRRFALDVQADFRQRIPARPSGEAAR